MQVISEDLGLKLETADISMMGRAKKITITKDDTIILDGSGDKSAIGERCDQIREAIAQSQSDYDRCCSHKTILGTTYDNVLTMTGFGPIVHMHHNILESSVGSV